MNDAPPPYDFKSAASSRDEKASMDAGPAPIWPSSSTGAVLRLQFEYKDWSARHGTIRDAATGQIIYTSEHRYRKPTFALNDPQGRSVATASSHLLTNKFDCEIDGRKFELTPRHKMGMTITYESPAFGQTLTWQRGSWWSSGMHYTLLDENAAPIARFVGGGTSKSMPFGGFGDLEFAAGRVESDALRDEVVATGLALAYRAAMNHNGAVAAAVAS